MHIEDAVAFIVDCVAKPRSSSAYSSYDYEVYVPNIIMNFLKEVERPAEHESTWRDGPRVRELAPAFSEAAWELCRRGILRPGIRSFSGQGDGHTGHGYTVTAFGRDWISKSALTPIILDRSRLGQLFDILSKQLGRGFQQRATEAATCHALGCYLASCAMCGAAAESILLAVAVAKSGDEESVLRTYLGSQGRRRTIDGIVHGTRPGITEPFKRPRACCHTGGTKPHTALPLRFPKSRRTLRSPGSSDLRNLLQTIGLTSLCEPPAAN